MLKIFFAGVPECAVPSLKMIAKDFNLCGILTSPPAGAGRNLFKKDSEISKTAAQLKSEGLIPDELPVLTPAVLNSDFRGAVSVLKPDLLVCFAYGKIFGAKTMALFPKGGINIHPSLLPRWRGCSPVPASIYAGDEETGVTIQTIAPKADCGSILAQEKFPIGQEDTSESILKKSAEIGAELLFGVLRDFDNRIKNAKPQNDEEATYCTALTKADGLIDWKKSVQEIDRHIRAFMPWPGSYTFCGEKKLNILKAAPYFPEEGNYIREGKNFAGKVLGTDKNSGILVGTGNGILAIKELQWETKKKLIWKDFLNGSPKFLDSVLSVLH